MVPLEAYFARIRRKDPPISKDEYVYDRKEML